MYVLYTCYLQLQSPFSSPYSALFIIEEPRVTSVLLLNLARLQESLLPVVQVLLQPLDPVSLQEVLPALSPDSVGLPPSLGHLGSGVSGRPSESLLVQAEEILPVIAKLGVAPFAPVRVQFTAVHPLPDMEPWETDRETRALCDSTMQTKVVTPLFSGTKGHQKGIQAFKISRSFHQGLHNGYTTLAYFVCRHRESLSSPF